MKKLSKEFYFELAVFCVDYHSGQWSRGYRLQCRLTGPRASMSQIAIQDARDSEAYAWLVTHYAGKV